MNNSSCCCTCKNVQINGQVTKHSIHSNIKPIKNNLLRVRITTNSIQKQSVYVYNFKRVKGNSINSSYQYLKCLTCGIIFVFSTTQNHFFVEKIEPYNGIRLHSILKKENNMKASFRRKLICKNDVQNNNKTFFNLNINNSRLFDDGIFDYMFSNKLTPVFDIPKNHNDTSEDKLKD